MGLTRKSDSNTVYLEVKHYSLWRGLKKPVEGCEELEVANPKTGLKVKKYGYSYRSIFGRAVKLVKYDTEHKYSQRYFGFKLHMVDQGATFVIDMPYHSMVLRRFLSLARNIDWNIPFTLTVFKGKKKEASRSEDTGIWFEQGGATVKPYYTKENLHGCPPGTQDPDTHEWDFRSQHRWLVDRLKMETIPDIEAAAAHVAPPIEPDQAQAEHDVQSAPDEDFGPPANDFGGITDDDVPF